MSIAQFDRVINLLRHPLLGPLATVLAPHADLSHCSHRLEIVLKWSLNLPGAAKVASLRSLLTCFLLCIVSRPAWI